MSRLSGQIQNGEATFQRSQIILTSSFAGPTSKEWTTVRGKFCSDASDKEFNNRLPSQAPSQLFPLVYNVKSFFGQRSGTLNSSML